MTKHKVSLPEFIATCIVQDPRTLFPGFLKCCFQVCVCQMMILKSLEDTRIFQLENIFDDTFQRVTKIDIVKGTMQK